MIDNLRSLRRAFELIALRLATGSTLDAALRQQKQTVPIPVSIARQWNWLRDAMLNGQIPARAGVDAFLGMLETHELCATELRQRGRNAQIQSHVLTALGVLMVLAVSKLMGEPCFTWLNAVAIAWCGVGFIFLRIVQRRVGRGLWRLEWLMFWFYVGAIITWGQTPAQAVSQTMVWCPLSGRVPESLRLAIQTLAADLRQHRETEPPPFSSRRVEAMDSDILEHFGRAARDGLQSSKILGVYTDQYRTWIQRSLREQAETSAYLNLIPLYLCFAPAIFLVIFGSLAKNFL